MSFMEICLASVLIGTIGTLLIAIIIVVSSRRYCRELIEAGGAQTTLGSIGCVYLESKAQVLLSWQFLQSAYLRIGSWTFLDAINAGNP